MLTGIHHAQVCCRRDEIEAAAAFYTRLLGMKPIDRPTGSGWQGGGVWLQAGTQQLHIGIEDELSSDQRRQTRHHVAYTVHDVDALADRLQAAGVAVERDLPAIPGARRVQLRDPAGNQVELIQFV